MIMLISTFAFVAIIFTYWEVRKHSISAIYQSLESLDNAFSKILLNELDFYLNVSEKLSLEIASADEDLISSFLDKFVLGSKIENSIAAFYDKSKDLLITSYINSEYGINSSDLIEMFDAKFLKTKVHYFDNFSGFIIAVANFHNEESKKVGVILNIIDFYKFVFNKIAGSEFLLSLWNNEGFIFLGSPCLNEQSDCFLRSDFKYDKKIIESGSFLSGNKCISIVSRADDNLINFAISANKKFTKTIFFKSLIYVSVTNLTIFFIAIFLIWIMYIAICVDLSFILSMFNSKEETLLPNNVINSSLSRINDIALNVLSLQRNLSLMKRQVKDSNDKVEEALRLKNCAFEIVNDVNFKFSKIKSDLISSNFLKEIFEDQSQFYKDQLNAKKEIERRKSELLANIGHETRTPLNAIIGFSEMIMRSKLCNDRGEEYIRIIYDSSRYMSKLIEEIMDFSRAELNYMIINEEFVNLEYLIQSSVEMTSKNYNKCDQQNFNVVVDSNIEVLVDKVKMQQVIINVLSNAIKFASVDVGHCIDIESNICNDYMNVIISDNGIGIASVELTSITDLFNQASNSSSLKVNDGIGLGLSLAKKIIELHGGLLSIDSVLNKGTKVTIKLPISRVKKILECC